MATDRAGTLASYTRSNLASNTDLYRPRTFWHLAYRPLDRSQGLGMGDAGRRAGRIGSWRSLVCRPDGLKRLRSDEQRHISYILGAVL